MESKSIEAEDGEAVDASGDGEIGTPDGEPARPYRLTDEQIEQITSRLRSGSPLPPYLLPHLFERPRESDLTYAGKMRRVDVVAETMALPLQPVKTVGGGSEDSWSNMLVLGDNLQVLRTLLEKKRLGQLRNADGTDGVRLCYIDPPFATRRDFQGAKGQTAYADRVEGAEFIEFLRRRLILIHELLADDGSLYLHLDEKKSHYIKVVLDEIFGSRNFRREIVWDTRVLSGFKTKAKNWVRGHDSLLFYTKGSDFVFNKLSVPHDQAYLDRFDQEDEEGRKYFGGRGERRYLDDAIEKGKAIGDVWDDIMSFQQMPTSREKTGYPTQKPLALLDRVIRASSNPGDIVLDCFAGSGTTFEAAELCEDGRRRWIGVDCGKFAIYTTQSRLLRMEREVSFTTFNAGLYDYEAVRNLDWDAFRAFALRLFQCRDEPVEVGGFRFDGIFQDDPVHVFNFSEQSEDVKIGRDYAEDIAEVAGSGLGERCFVIAPALSVEPYEDYLDVKGTRFYFLRIPYSVIAELHKRTFSELRQPDSEEVANATIDATGFDFINPPSVECTYRDDGTALFVDIDRFESRAYNADDSEEEVAGLAMVMLDYDYDGAVFDLDAALFAEGLAETDWSIEISKDEVADQIMIVYLDIFGNEHRETKQVSDFETA
jgi:DNA modification methylase